MIKVKGKRARDEGRWMMEDGGRRSGLKAKGERSKEKG
jgi:hypothetical protein